jgi:hypothetical protein
MNMIIDLFYYKKEPGGSLLTSLDSYYIFIAVNYELGGFWSLLLRRVNTLPFYEGIN